MQTSHLDGYKRLLRFYIVAIRMAETNYLDDKLNYDSVLWLQIVFQSHLYGCRAHPDNRSAV